jgi:hypothetical protein
MSDRIRTPDLLRLPRHEDRMRAALEHAPEPEVRLVADDIVAAVYASRDTSDLRPLVLAMWRAKALLGLEDSA